MNQARKLKVGEGFEESGEWQLAQAFARDTTRAWPPRSYTCTFCSREFRSAQALGGHMNVHRRDRARFHHQAQAQTQPTSIVESSFPDAVGSDGGGGSVRNLELTLFYELATDDVDKFEVMPLFRDDNSVDSTRWVLNDETKVINTVSYGYDNDECKKINEVKSPTEELDLELRL